ncbi:MAG: discoidin domain-containing protein [Deltaproteobacteria bacterium]|nr:discoidin domain-containing protein [Deltaproteobacteria bacterium]
MKSQLTLAETVLDDFTDISGWKTVAADGVRVELGQDDGPNGGKALRIDFDFSQSGGFVLVRKDAPLPLPANYAFRYQLRAAAPKVNFEFKLIDKSGKNVWWYRERDVQLPAEWTERRIKKPRIEFAWGPASGGAPKDIVAMEIAVTGAEGDKGSVWLDDLVLEERPLPPRTPPAPRASASASAPGEPPAQVLDGSQFTRWKSGTLSSDQWLQLDFGRPREYGGLVIDWDDHDYAVGYDVQASDDGKDWRTLYSSTRSNGARDYVYLPDGESHALRLKLNQSSRGEGYGIKQVAVLPLELAASPNDFFTAMAREAAPGTYPKYFSGQQTYWTVLGVDGDAKEALLNEEGMLEIEKGGFSIEPFLFLDGKLVTWSDVQTGQELEDGYLPIPTVTWYAGPVSLAVTAFASGPAGASQVFARYRLDNTSDTAREVTLFLAVRPFQVLPPWQSLNMVGGTTPIHELVFDARTLWVDGRAAVRSLTPPTTVGATTFDEGQVTESLLDGVVPQRQQVVDPVGYASAALAYQLRLPPQGHQEVYIAAPFYDADEAVASCAGDGAEALVTRELAATIADWRRRLDTVAFRLPPDAQDIAHAVKSTLAYILINRAGPAIQPGSRTYARSWIRDGAMTSTALLDMGVQHPVREFLRWYARYQYADGKIPCCIDRHGPDPLPEHDSNGEFLFAIGEYYRYTRDIGLVNELWPKIVLALDYLEKLRAQRLTDEYKSGAKQAFYGLLPESISHEGYASRPVHSYWDDFFALAGLKSAVQLAVAQDDAATLARATALRDGLQTDLQASIRRVLETRKIDFIPGSADLADYDPSSSSIALDPAGEQDRLPPEALRRTFLRYYEELMGRVAGTVNWEAYAPYELRNVGVLVRLGEREKALEVLDTLMQGRRPAAWNEWAEVVWKDAGAPKFIGDMPHTWVAAGFVESVRTMFAYERDAALILAHGVPRAWVESPGGTGVQRLPTPFGILSYTLDTDGPSLTRMRLSGDLVAPPDGLVLRPPLPAALRAATVNGQPAELTDGAVIVRSIPADVRFEH